MNENELIIAISNLLDEKLYELELKLNKNMDEIGAEVNAIKSDVEKNLKPTIKALGETYLPKISRY